MSKAFKKDDDAEVLPFQNLEKGLVLQETRIFSKGTIETRKCYQLLTKVLFLITKGDVFTTKEATDVFFAVTKLFQSKDVSLRRMVYLVLKELTTVAEDTIIATAILTKDVNSNVDIYKANAIRVLARITDATMLGQLERYMKQAIVDKDPYVSSSALVSGYHLMENSSEIVKRWVSEVQEALNGRTGMVQYHALGLLHKIRQRDRLAISKLVQSLTQNNSIRSHFAHSLLIRFAVQVMEESPQATKQNEILYDYLESCLRHKNEIVVYEAARSICNLKNISAKDLTPAITVLQMFLGSPKPTLRFAAVRTLNKVASEHPHAIAGSCSYEMEGLINDANRNVATLAITTLLKVESDGSIDRLMKQIGNFISDISDEFKIVVVEAIRTLALKYRQRHYSIMGFLFSMLREEGGFSYKKSIVETLLEIIREIPESKENGLAHLCEFIEDCEFTPLMTKVLHLLGKEGPQTRTPAKYIRYIYNRIILENETVRASAVSALAKFGLHHESLRPKVIVLLNRCLQDNDDEVRDRATFYLQMLENNLNLTKDLVSEDLPVPLLNLELSLRNYLDNPIEAPFDIQTVPAIEIRETQRPSTKGSDIATYNVKSPEVSVEKINTLPEFSGLGPLFNTSKVLELTESETEYVVKCVKHVFAKHIVFQFNVTNTLNDQVLENVSVDMSVDESSGFKLDAVIPVDCIAYSETKSIFVKCNLPTTQPIATATFMSILKFDVKDIDTESGVIDEDSAVQDEYQLEDLEVTIADFMKKNFVPDFATAWSELEEGSAVETFSLSSVTNCADAVKEIIEYLGMQPCDRSEVVPPKRTKHILYLSGNAVGGIGVLARVRMRSNPNGGVSMELTVRSSNLDLSSRIASSMYS